MTSFLEQSLLIISFLAACINMLLLVYLLYQIRRLERLWKTQESSSLELHQAMKVLSGEAFVRGQDQSVLIRTLNRLADQQNELRLELRLRDSDHTPYAQAIKLIRSGQPREQVKKLCALTDSELDLLFGLHGHGTHQSPD